MVIRPGGYNTGAQEYLENGTKAGREFTRDELDQRMIIDGCLDITRSIYESIPDRGQDRYLTFTLSFKEDVVADQQLRDITQEFKQFLMHAYEPDEFNFYAEAHLPKMKTIVDKKTGEIIDRKPHIHIIVPRVNLLSGNEANPVDVYNNHIKYFEAFQEYINQKYDLASPREHVRVNIADAASVLSRYKGDDFYGKNREFKQELVKQIIERGITDRQGFYNLVAESGETRIRNQGKDNEYISVRLPGDAKGTNLKDTIFQDDFLVRRELKKPPLEAHLIQERLLAWPQRAKEIKYVNKATPKFRKEYSTASPEDRVRLLAERETKFYQIYGGRDGGIHPNQRQGDRERGPAQASTRGPAQTADGLQDLSLGDVADHRQAGSSGRRDGAVLLPGDAHIHVGQSQPGRDSGLRPAVRGGRRGRGGHEQSSTEGRAGRHERSAAVSEGAAGEAAARAGRGGGRGTTRPRGARGARSARSAVVPPYARNPHRVATVADIEQRARMLFDPLKRPVDNELFIQRPASLAPEPATKPRRKDKAGSAGRRRAQAQANIPPYARNPHRVAGIADIEQRARMLFDPLKRPVDNELVIKRPSMKALTANKQASTVAAYFTRQFEHNRLAKPQRSAIRRVDQQFHTLRRALFSDDRLSRQDKAQLVAVLTFERLKAREQIYSTSSTTEVDFMGSASIRELLEPEEDIPGFTISGDRGKGPEGIRDRVKRITDRLHQRIDPQASEEQVRALSAKDIYTRKAKFSQNVHYLDKVTDKTLFVDTGKAISMRRGGITEAGVAVALQLAKERFGSTLTINGTADFKRMVIDAVAKNGLDVHFTDKSMNESLAARRIELELEKNGGATIAAATDLPRHVDEFTQASRDLTDRLGLTVPIEALYGEGKSTEEISRLLAPQLAEHVPQQERIGVIAQVATTLGIPDRSQPGGDVAFEQWQASRLQPQQQASAQTQPAEREVPAYSSVPAQESPSDLVRREDQWRQTMPVSEADVWASDTMMGLRGEDHANWIITGTDTTPEGAAMLTAYMENDAYRASFKDTLSTIFHQAKDQPETIQMLTEATAPAVAIVNQIERRLRAEAAPAEQAASAPDLQTGPKPITGVLLDHGAAPYKHEEKGRASYFVTVQTGAGDRTLWGVGLESAMKDAGLEKGDQVKLQDLGTTPVEVQDIAEDGTVTIKTAKRREWSAVRIEPERHVAVTTPKGLAEASPTGLAPDEEQGMGMD